MAHASSKREFKCSRPVRKILVVSGVRGDTRRYRALHLIEQLCICGLRVDYTHLIAPSFSALLRKNWDLIIFHRIAYQDFLKSDLQWVKENGVTVLSDFDDLIFDPSMFSFIDSPDFGDPVRAKLYKEKMNGFRTMLEMSDGAIASTDFLCDRIRLYHKPTWIHRNAFSYRMLICSNRARNHPDHLRKNSRVVIGYASGTPTHNRDFEMIRPALRRVLDRYPHVDLHLIGPLDPGSQWVGTSDRVYRKKLVPWEELPDHLARFDINLAPLIVDNPFSQSKSEIKFMEAGMVAVPTVASPTDAFLTAIQHGQNGFLASSVADWEETLSLLVESTELRKETGEAAYRKVMAEYHPMTRAEQLVQKLEEMSQRLRGDSFWRGNPPTHPEIEIRSRQASVEENWAPAEYDRGPTNIQMGLFSLRHTGIKTTILQVWVFFRRLLSPIFPFQKL